MKIQNNVFASRRKAIDYAIWCTFSDRKYGIHYVVLENEDETKYLVVPGTNMPFEKKGIPLPENYADMSYEDVRVLRTDTEPLDHWETICGMISVMDGQLLRFLIRYQVPLEKLIRYELASRGHDEDMNWVGFDRAKVIWMK